MKDDQFAAQPSVYKQIESAAIEKASGVVLVLTRIGIALPYFTLTM